MDYDENSFQSQNFQLVGEDKFSANLRPFPLPKFDLDEHLSFHSLVEQEVLLSIQGQENNWIDFPPGSSALEFSSSAAESCSIARHNNVWSEATSSESVDLLLKSMGEDEMINNKSVIMDMSANNESHGIHNQVDLYAVKDDAHESSMMDILPADPELAQDKSQKKLPGSNECQWELLPNFQGSSSSQAPDEEESRIAMYVDPSNRNLSLDEKIDRCSHTIVNSVTSLYNVIEKSKLDGKGLCGEVLYEKDVYEVLLKTEVPSSDVSDSYAVDGQSLACNQDKLDIEADKLNAGLFCIEQEQRNISSSSGSLGDNVHKEKSLVMHNETNEQLGSKSDALALLNTKSIDSLLPVNSGLVVAVPCQTKSLNSNSEGSEKSLAEEVCMSSLAMKQEERIEHNSVTLQTTTQLIQGFRSLGDSLPCNFVEDDAHGRRIPLMKNSAMSCDNEGKLERCIDAINNNQDPEGELVENKNNDATISTQLMIESPASIHNNYGTQDSKIEDCERMSTNSLSFTCEKPGVIVEVNHDKHMDVDRQEVKLDENKDVAAEDSSLPVVVSDEFCLPITVTDKESRISPSTYCELNVDKETISVHASVDKEVSLNYIGPISVNLDSVSNVTENVEDLAPAIRNTAEGSSLDRFADKLLEENIGKKGLLMQGQSVSDIIHFVSKDEKISAGTALSLSATDLIEEKESDFVSVSYPLNMKDTSVDKTPDGDSGALLASAIKSPNSQLSKGNVVGSENTLQLGGNGVAQGPSQEEKDDIPNSLEVVSSVGNEVSAALAQNASGRQAKHMPPSIDKDSSRKSPSNEQNDHYKLPKSDVSDEQNASTKTEGCHQDNLEHQDLEASGNMPLAPPEKDEIIHKVDCSSNGLLGTSVEARSLTPEVSTSEDLAGRGAGSELSFLKLKANDISQMLNENSQGLPEEVKLLDSSMKTPNLGKLKNASRPSNEKKTVSKGKAKKESHSLKQSSVMDVKSSSSVCKSVGIVSKGIPLAEMQEHSSTEFSIKTSSSVAIKTSIIPDLNSASSLALFHQPFTDFQQVQLRAQIFVYGSLISGMPPDEAYMVSSFGGTDGGRNLWEGVWHTWIARFQNKKSPVVGYDTPTHSRPAIWISEQVSMGIDVQSKVPSTSATNDSIIISSAGPISTMPLPSSLWSHPYGNDGHHASLSRGSYLNFSHSPSAVPHQTLVSRHHVGANLPWLSQSPRPGPWFASSQISALDGVKRYSTASVPETVHVTPARDSCGPQAPTVEVIPSRVLTSVTDTTIITTTSNLQMETSKRAATSGDIKYNSTTKKARKRKKVVAAEETCLPASQTLDDPVSAVCDVRSLSLPSTSMLSSSNSHLNIASPPSALISMPHIISPTHYQIIGANNNVQKAILSEETCSKIERAKLQAEEAAALAASTVKHSEDVWSRLASLKNSGLISQMGEKLASAAVAAAVASSVAKAAAAAANIAVGAALQAKLMADEVMSVSKTGNTVLSSESGILDVGKKLVGISSVSILKGMDKIHGSGAATSTESEVARIWVDSSSAATKRAENLDAIVKAAELAAEAVAQAGTILTMGDPLPFTLSQLIDAGPEGFWRGHDGSSIKLPKSRSTHVGEHLGLGSAKNPGGSAKQLEVHFSEDKETQKATDESGLSSLNEYHEQFERRTQGNLSIAGHEIDHPVSSIQKGSVVEVMPDEDGRKGAWFSAQVLDVDDNKAYVCYKDVSTTEGQLKEWIVLEDGEKAPRIRVAHSTTLVKYGGTRKRRREHVGSYILDIGDHVDAWIHDRWWEGTIIEKTPGDEAKLTVHFPARCDKQVVHAWDLRPSRIWKDGRWIEWSHAKGKAIKPHEGDTPQEKRQRLSKLEGKNHSEVDTAKMGKLIEESRKPNDSRSLALSAKERTFSIGKNSREEVISDALKPKRTGLQREGSRVVFGVPRPGKKRKFMEVSKHYVANKSEKISKGNDSIKFAKYLMPQASRQSRNVSKVDNKGKKAVEIKPRGGSKAENSRSFQTRSLSEKDKASLSTSNEDTVNVHHGDVISSFRDHNNCLDSMNALKFSSLPSQADKIDVSAVPLAVQPISFSTKKKTSGFELDLAAKPKVSMGKTSTVEDKGSGNHGKSIREVMEPRRSNRRGQPTSRLLEGLQSSLVIPKFTSVSHERKPVRGGSSSRETAHG